MSVAKLFSNRKGDTIVEVLIALSILGMVLGLSYALASRSMKTSQSAQERTEASQIAQSLIEIVKVYAQRDIDAVFPAAPQEVCFSRNLQDISPPNGNPPMDPILFDASSPLCNQGFYQFRVAITPLPPGASGLPEYEYAAFVNWDNIAAGRDEAVMRYKFVRVPTP